MADAVVIRKTADIEFPGWDPTISHLIAEVELAKEPEWGIRNDALGPRSLSKLRMGVVRVLVTEQQLGPTDEPTLHDLSEALIAVYGTDYGIHSPISISRFTDVSRQAASYREGACCWPATPRTCIIPRADKVSISACRMR